MILFSKPSSPAHFSSAICFARIASPEARIRPIATSPDPGLATKDYFFDDLACDRGKRPGKTQIDRCRSGVSKTGAENIAPGCRDAISITINLGFAWLFALFADLVAEDKSLRGDQMKCLRREVAGASRVGRSRGRRE
jgi:hypothetical protein